MKKIFLLLAVAFTIVTSLFAQKPSIGAIQAEKVPMYCSSGDTGRTPILFRLRIQGLNPGSQYKYYASCIAISDTGSNVNGVGNPILFKNNGSLVYSTNAGFTAGNHDTFTASFGGDFTNWFGVVNTANSRFTAGSYVYPMIVFQDIGPSPVTKKWYIRDSIKVLSFSTSSGGNNGSAIYGKSFAKAKNIVELYDDVSFATTRPINIALVESKGTSIASMPYWYSNKVNAQAGFWGTIIPNSLSNGIQRIEHNNFSTGNLVYSHKEADATWGSDSTKNQRKGLNPIFIKSDYAPLIAPDIQFNTNVTNATEGNTIVNLLVNRKYGNADSTKVTYAIVVGSATNTVDYDLNTTKPLVFKPYGDITDTIKVKINDDLMSETNEDLAVKLISTVNGVIGTQTTHTVNIIDNDIPLVTFDKKGSTISETAGSIKVKVRIKFGSVSATNFRVVVKSKGDSTLIPQEFKFGSSNRDSTLKFNGNKVNDSLEFKLAIINDNLVEDRPDTIVLAIRNTTSPAIAGADSLYTLIINDNDAPPKYAFAKKEIIVNENAGNVRIRVNIAGRNISQSDIGVRFSTGASTATEGSDLTYNPTTQIFSVNPTDPDSITIDIPILDNSVFENTENAIFILSPFSNASLGKPDTLKIVILDNDLPEYTIAKLTTEKTAGIADSLNVKCRIKGVAYGINMKPTGSPAGYAFTLIDATGGIQIYSANGSNGYTVAEGDSLSISGTVGQFEGLTRFDNVINITKLGTKALRAATVASDITEANESRLIKLNTLKLVNSSQWPTAAMAANTTAVVQVANQTTTFDMLIDSDTDIDGTPAPSGFFNVIGIGSQSDATNPFTSGYQIVPRRLTDIENIASPTFTFTPTTANAVENRDSTPAFTIQCANITSNQQITIEIKGGTAARNTDYISNPTRTFLLTPAKPSISIKTQLKDDILSESPETIIWVLRGNSYGTIIGADSIHTITIIDDETVGIAQTKLAAETVVYPNPAADNIAITSTANILSISIVDMNGKVVKTLSNINETTAKIAIDELSKGIYTAKITTDKGTINKPFTIVK